MVVICNDTLFTSQFYKYKISNGPCKPLSGAPMLTLCYQAYKWPLNGLRWLDLDLYFKCLLEGKMPSKLLFIFRDQIQSCSRFFVVVFF